MTPYWASDDGRIRLYHGDCRGVLPELGVQADLIVADPPYGETSLPWDRWPDGWPAVAAQCARSMWFFGSMRMFLDRRDEFAAWRLSHEVIWEKQNGTGFATDRFRRVHEIPTHWYHGPWKALHHQVPRVHVGVREPNRTVAMGKGHAAHLGTISKGAWTDDGTRLMPSVIRAPNMWRRGAIHPCQKPVELLDPLIRYGCPPGGLVLDPFAGSGSTLDCARTLGMRAIGIEADARYCEGTVKRASHSRPCSTDRRPPDDPPPCPRR